MFPRGSSRKSSNPGYRTGPRSKGLARSPGPVPQSNSLHGDLLREFHASGIYEFAENIGIIQNGELSLSNSGVIGSSSATEPSEGRDAHEGMEISASAAGPSSMSVDSGSMGSPSAGNEAVVGITEPNGGRGRLQHLDMMEDDPESPGVVGRKKKRGQRAVAGEKGGKGLRHFSMKVCEKVESKVRTTYNEVADELVAEFTNPDNISVSPDQQQYDEKNIRRRVYDALNVLMAMDIISKEKKEIQWKGLPSTSVNNIDQLKDDRIRLATLIEKKSAYLQDLQDQLTGLQNLVRRNERIHRPDQQQAAVALPFILVQTRPQATVEVEISEDMQLVHFDFNSTPFELHDDAYVLKAMSFCERQNSERQDGGPHTHSEEVFEPPYDDRSSSPVPNLYQRPSIMSMSPRHCGPYPVSAASPPPVPSILKARVKHENFP